MRMGKFTYENQGTVSYLVYEIDNEAIVDHVCLGMITNNRINGFVPVIKSQFNERKYLKYDISSRVTASQVLADTVNSKRLLGIFRGIVDALISADEFMINIENIVLDLDYMYVDVATFQTELICLPIKIIENNQDISTFLKNIMFQVRIDPNENSSYFMKLLGAINSANSFSVVSFRNLIDELQRESMANKFENREEKQKVVKQVQQSRKNVLIESSSADHSRMRPLNNEENMNVSIVRNEIKMSDTNQRVASSQNSNSQNSTVSNIEQTAQASEKAMSMFYLLQHYSKENVEKYKAQKKQEKQEGKVKDKKKKPNKGGKKNSKSVEPDFRIPGQENNPVASPVMPMDNSSVMSVPVQGQNPVQRVFDRSQKKDELASFGQTTILDENDDSETVILGAMNDSSGVSLKPMLIRKKNNEEIIISKDMFIIGKEKSYVDYCISDNRTISRSHAKIITQAGMYYIVDTNSTNHVFVNNNMITCNQAVQLSPGDLVRLSDEEFVFSLR